LISGKKERIMSDVFDYDKQVAEIKAYNQPILQRFHDGLKSSGLVEKTIRSHVENIEFFVEYLVSYDPLKARSSRTRCMRW
jgi:hypothetical protein